MASLKRVILVLLALFLVITQYSILSTEQATHYDVSVYSVYPFWVWLNLVVIVGVSSFYYCTITISETENRNVQYWLMTILTITNVTVLLIPLFRGYFIYGRTDELEHLGKVRDILLTGHIGDNNFYPLMHILISDIFKVSNIFPNVLTVLLPSYFWAISLFWFYIFVKNTLGDIFARASLIAWALFPLGYWHTTMVGNMFAYYLIFLGLAVWASDIQKLKKSVLISIIIFALVYFHPLQSIYFIVALVAYTIFSKISQRNFLFSKERSIFYVLGIFVSAWTAWYLSFKETQRGLVLFLSSLIEPSENPFVKMYVSIASRYELPITKLLQFALYKYFGVFAYLIGLFLFMIIYKNRKSLFFRYLPFFVLSLIFIFWSGMNIFLHTVNFERSLRFILAFSLPAGAMIYFRYLPKKNKALAIFIILLISYFAIFTVHKSPLSGQLNSQVSSSEYYGMGWWFDNRNENWKGYEDGQITQYRFYEAMYGSDKALEAKNLLYFGAGRSLIPEHFNFISSKPVYIIVGRAIFDYYNATMPEKKELWRLHPFELTKLKTSREVEVIYSSSDISIYLKY
ncbi:hypothetical protein [Thermococcus aciditolerans]|uniref:Glycosyltransferase RgtA/B/C/D-like domain-containing protein n=1 Tax=Thermococcus aciditolerans TaxID=2598455 RepID=A0A5C0SMJ6_9EURY|nr:hypothetical protein [Thermococcus aciditolerans]QEK14956.1 hypothetical protein FPV09_07475 [Thermococcus aciditolerans]